MDFLKITQSTDIVNGLDSIVARRGCSAEDLFGGGTVESDGGASSSAPGDS